MANAGIYDRYVQPLQSVQDVQNGLLQQDHNQLLMQSQAAQMQAHQQALAEAQQYKQMVRTTGGDPARMREGMVGLGMDTSKFDHDQAALGEINAKAAKEKGAARIQQLTEFHDKSKALSRMLSSADPHDDEAIVQVYERGAKLGLIDVKDAVSDIETAPPKGTPERVKWFNAKKAEAVDVIDQQKQDLEQSKAAQTKTHQDATLAEQIRARDQSNATTIRGQNMVDSRARATHSDTMAQAGKPVYDAERGIWVSRDGTSVPVMANGVPIGPKADNKPLTETQGKATTFVSRMQDAEKSISALEAEGVSGKDFRTLAARSDYTNFLASPKGQQYRQAQENWVTANLRQESGAAIGKDEMAKDVRKFFPTIGDAPEVIAQKSAARRVAAAGMLAQAGPGAKQVPGIVNAGGAAPTGNPKKIASDGDYSSLPSGAEFIAPDGSHRRKP